MKFSFSKFGNIERGNIELGNLTIICGPNNVGKTYISYAIYGFLSRVKSLVDSSIVHDDIDTLLNEKIFKFDIEKYFKQFPDILNIACENFSKELDNYFKVNSGYFSNSKVRFLFQETNPNNIKNIEITSSISFGVGKEISFFKEANSLSLTITLVEYDSFQNDIPKNILRNIISDHVIRLLLDPFFPEALAVTSERTGVALFYKELDTRKNRIFEHLTENKDIDPLQLLRSMSTRYAKPINDNIKIIRDFEDLSKKESYIVKNKNKTKYKTILKNLKDLMGGSYKLQNEQVMYCPDNLDNKENIEIPVHISSSSIKSLFLIDMYINYLAEKDGWLIIDEPELNLHPVNQKKMAGLLVSLVNADINVVITTHSDFLIREINNRIMLDSAINKEKLMEKLNINKQEILSPKKVKAYVIQDKSIFNQKVDKYGIELNIFDNFIDETNNITDMIYHDIQL